MSDYTLTAKSPLGGFAKQFDGIAIAELTGKALISIATPNEGEQKLSKAITKAFMVDRPPIGMSTVSGDHSVCFFGIQQYQLFVLLDYKGERPVDHIAEKLGPTGYFTDQSDSWVMLEISGPKCRIVLQRICSLDLHPDVFVEGSVACTTMDHLGTIIYRTGTDSFILFSACSSAKSFLHAIETSIQNIL